MKKHKYVHYPIEKKDTAVDSGMGVVIVSTYTDDSRGKIIVSPNLTFFDKLKILFSRQLIFICGEGALHNINYVTRCKNCQHEGELECPGSSCSLATSAPFYTKKNTHKLKGRNHK